MDRSILSVFDIFYTQTELFFQNIVKKQRKKIIVQHLTFDTKHNNDYLSRFTVLAFYLLFFIWI